MMITLHLDDAIIRSLSKHELTILQFIYEHPNNVLDSSIREFAQNVGYSTASVLRFCKKLGYSGYAELKYVVRSQVKADLPDMKAESKHVFHMSVMMEQLSSNIESTSKLIHEDQLNQAFQFFDSAYPLYIWMPAGVTHVVCEYLEKMLFFCGRQKVFRLESVRVAEHLLQNLREDAVLVLISSSGTYDSTIRLAKVAKMNNIPILSIVPYNQNVIADLSEVSFRFFTYQRENLGAEFTSRLPLFYLIDMIIRCYLQYKQTDRDDPDWEGQL